jgi:hypothetical protein
MVEAKFEAACRVVRQRATWNDRPPDALCLCLRRAGGCSSDVACLKRVAAPGPLHGCVSSYALPECIGIGRALAPGAGRVTLGLSLAVSCKASGSHCEHLRRILSNVSGILRDTRHIEEFISGSQRICGRVFHAEVFLRST